MSKWGYQGPMIILLIVYLSLCPCRLSIFSKLQNRSLTQNRNLIYFINQQIYTETQMFAHTNKLFLIIIVLSILTYFERPDYNLPLFGFALLLWDYKQPRQKTRLWYLMAISLITDAIWIIYWAITWNSYENREHAICMFTIVVSVLQFIVKIVTVIITFAKQAQCKAAITELPNNIKSIMKPPTNQYGRV